MKLFVSVLLVLCLVEIEVEEISLRNSQEARVKAGPGVLGEEDVLAVWGDSDRARAVVVLTLLLSVFHLRGIDVVLQIVEVAL